MAKAKKKSFALGYSLVINALFMYFLFGSFTTAGQNVWVSAFCNAYGWSNTTLLNVATYGSLIGVFGSLLFGQMITKRGARQILTISVIICGAAIILFGYSASIGLYLFCMAVFNFTGHGFCTVGANTVIGNWFPGRKGFVLGIASMGMPAAPFLFVPLLNRLLGSFGLQNAFLSIGIVVIILGVITFFWVRNTPQEVGLLPDNGTIEYKAPAASKVTRTVGQLLKNRNAWFIGLAYGMLFMVNQGIVSQTVSYLMEHGFEQARAVTLLSMAALIGMISSVAWGVFDDKIGTKMTSIIYALWYAVTFVIMALAVSQSVALVALVMEGVALGGIGTLMPSMMMTVFGADQYASVSRTIQTIGNVVRSFAFMIVSIGYTLFGGYSRAPWLLAIATVVALLLIIGIKPETKPEAEQKS